MSSVIQNLISDFARLPGVGERTAERLVFHILRDRGSLISNFIEDLNGVRERVRFCSSCQNFTEVDPCAICSDERRNRALICVVEEPSALAAIEKTKVYRGGYHVLHGLLSPLDGVGPEELKIAALSDRLKRENVEELIIATATSVSGDATALYLSRLFQPLSVKITRLSSGMPVGTALEYIDSMTLSRALEHRVNL